MTLHTVNFSPASVNVQVNTGTLIAEAARLAGIDISQPCGGQGRCGRCVIQIKDGKARRRSSLRLTSADIDSGYALSCQTIVEGDLIIEVPQQEKIERRLTTDRTISKVEVPQGYEHIKHQSIQRVQLKLDPPSMDDQIDDLSRIENALKQLHQIGKLQINIRMLRKLGIVLREGDWHVTAVIEILEDSDKEFDKARLISLFPGIVPEDSPLWGVAIDIGTTTVTVWLVDLISGQVKSQVSEYNQQISRGEDVISRIVYASKKSGSDELGDLVLRSINDLISKACKRVVGFDVNPGDVMKASISGNSTMIHLLLKIPPESIRLSPFITTTNYVPKLEASEIGIIINPNGTVDCLPGVASYVGSDITAGVFSSKMYDTDKVTLFMDVGTNGEIVLGSGDWLVTCACSAGPAFEGAGVYNGMRATKGAIEEVWINSTTYEPTYRVIGGGKPEGICGSGLISLLAEMFMTGVIDKAGNLKADLKNERIRTGDHGYEYVIAWATESGTGEDIVITKVDIDNLLRAKGAIFAGYQILANSVGVPLEMIEQMLIGGSFGKYINVEKAVQIGLLPDMPWDQFKFLGNTSVLGSYYALLDRKASERITDIASNMTYIELSADNSFYEAFMSALFLPHTDLSIFPSVEKELANKKDQII